MTEKLQEVIDVRLQRSDGFYRGRDLLGDAEMRAGGLSAMIRDGKVTCMRLTLLQTLHQDSPLRLRSYECVTNEVAQS